MLVSSRRSACSDAGWRVALTAKLAVRKPVSCSSALRYCLVGEDLWDIEDEARDDDTDGLPWLSSSAQPGRLGVRRGRGVASMALVSRSSRSSRLSRSSPSSLCRLRGDDIACISIPVCLCPADGVVDGAGVGKKVLGVPCSIRARFLGRVLSPSRSSSSSGRRGD